GYLARFRRRKDRCARLAPTTTRATITNDPAIAAQNWTGPDGTSRITTPATRKDSPASATQGAALRWTYAQASGSRMVNGVRIPSRGLGRSLPRAPSAPVAISSSPATAKTTVTQMSSGGSSGTSGRTRAMRLLSGTAPRPRGRTGVAEQGVIGGRHDDPTAHSDQRNTITRFPAARNPRSGGPL